MPFPFLAVATALQAIPGIASLFQKRPKAPEFPGMDDATRQRILESIRRRIDRQEGGMLRTTRQEAAARGGYRSGQLPRLETDIRKRASEDYADALTNVELSELESRRQWQRSIAGGEYSSRMQEYLAGQAGGGQALGSAAQNLLLMLQRNRGGSSGTYVSPYTSSTTFRQKGGLNPYSAARRLYSLMPYKYPRI